MNGCKPDTIPLIYHQDEKLTNQPSHIPLSVAHQVPIYDDFVHHFEDPADILSAFGTDSHREKKIIELRKNQEAGLPQLRRDNSFVFQISDIQGEYFKGVGIPQARIMPFPPPMHAMLTAHDSVVKTPADGELKLLGVDRKFFLFTAVARLAFF